MTGGFVNFDLGGIVRETGGAIDRVWTSDHERLEADLRGREIDAAPHLGQVAISKTEAGHKAWFVAGWRPAVGWVIALAFLYALIIEPLLGWVFVVWFPDVAPPPKVDDTQLVSILGMMLGLGGMRSWEKWKGVASSTIPRRSTGLPLDVLRSHVAARDARPYRAPSEYVPPVQRVLVDSEDVSPKTGQPRL